MNTLTVDFGGTRIKAGIVKAGKVLDTFVLDVSERVMIAQQLPRIKEAFLSRPAALRDDVRAMACALPCIVGPTGDKVVRTFGKYDDVIDFSVPEWSETELGLPAVLENDARAAAIGEWQCGAGIGCDHLVTVTLGTGIGTAVISGGKPLYGASGVAGNLGGHVLAELDGPQCVCGLRGCVEACVGTWALPAIARASVLFPTSALAHEAVIDYRTVFRLAKAGDQLASELRDKALKYWALLLINLTQAYDPQAIILGGGIMAGKADILPALTGLLQNQLHKMQHKPNLLAASLGDDAALAGLDFLCRNPSL